MQIVQRTSYVKTDFAPTTATTAVLSCRPEIDVLPDAIPLATAPNVLRVCRALNYFLKQQPVASVSGPKHAAPKTVTAAVATNLFVEKMDIAMPVPKVKSAAT